jgi:hypothetical protein
VEVAEEAVVEAEEAEEAEAVVAVEEAVVY